MGNKELVIQAGTELFGKRDTSAVDRYWSSTYRQHSAMIGDGPEPLREMVGKLPPNFGFTPVRMLADGDLVVTHAIYTGFGPEPLVAFDLFRIDDDKLAEHWDALTPQVKNTASGRSQTDGPTQVTRPDQTESSRSTVTDFIQTVFLDGQYDKVADFIDGENYAQHNPAITNGLSGLRAAITAMGEQGITMTYDTLHRVVAEGEFVYTLSEGQLGGKPRAFHDLFRVDGGKLVEHWDVVAEVPATLPHNNGLF